MDRLSIEIRDGDEAMMLDENGEYVLYDDMLAVLRRAVIIAFASAALSTDEDEIKDVIEQALGGG